MALAYYHLIPEHVATVTSVTTQRPGKYEFNRFSYCGTSAHRYSSVVNIASLTDDEICLCIMPEKPTIRHFRPQGDSNAYMNLFDCKIWITRR